MATHEEKVAAVEKAFAAMTPGFSDRQEVERLVVAHDALRALEPAPEPANPNRAAVLIGISESTGDPDLDARAEAYIAEGTELARLRLNMPG